MSFKPRLLVDCDGILSNFVAATLERVQLMTGKRFTPEQVTAWDVVECLGFDQDTCKSIYDSMRGPGFCEAIQPFPDAVAGIKRLRELGDVYIVTAPFGGDYWMAEREAWLKRHFDFQRHSIIHCHDKWVVSGDIIVDDRTQTLIKWREHNSQGTPILFERSYNKNDDWSGFRVPNWDSLLSVIKDVL